ncbi:hypothetical protein Bbelb_350930 [Branchiostoma belcheri]|nr:hypothetical protein Bbelb_350930 [Branchiostoma belcheri]
MCRHVRRRDSENSPEKLSKRARWPRLHGIRVPPSMQYTPCGHSVSLVTGYLRTPPEGLDLRTPPGVNSTPFRKETDVVAIAKHVHHTREAVGREVGMDRG